MKRKDNVFTDVMMSSPETSRFDLGHEKKFSFNMGELVPTCLMEVLPGDKFSLSYANLLRFAPLVSPVMHRIRVKTEYFFVPSRILFASWEEFITGVSEPPVAAPTVELDDVVLEGSLADYLGIPPGQYNANPLKVSALPFAAYCKIFDEYYRDQNLVTAKFVPLIPGDNSSAYAPILNDNPLFRAWEHDYFTSALPTSQQGSDVELPLVSQANIPVQYTPNGNGDFVVDPDTGLPFNFDGATGVGGGPVPFTSTFRADWAVGDNGLVAGLDNSAHLSVDIQGEAATINDLREAFSLQAFLERTIRGGARYIEQIRSHFGVKSSDARLQRPELIGRSSQNMVISEVLSTAQSSNDAATAQVTVGGLAGHGIHSGGEGGMHYSAEEHGFIIGIISVIPDTAYQDGVSRLWTKEDRLDYAWPSFAHLGEQEIRNKEVLAHDTDSDDYDLEGIFGYIPRYSEYRYHPSSVAGQFRSSLAFWTLGRQFNPASPPALNAEFVTCFPSRDIFAVVDENVDTILAQVINQHSVVRRLPRYGIPSTL